MFKLDGIVVEDVAIFVRSQVIRIYLPFKLTSVPHFEAVQEVNENEDHQKSLQNHEQNHFADVRPRVPLLLPRCVEYDQKANDAGDKEQKLLEQPLGLNVLLLFALVVELFTFQAREQNEYLQDSLEHIRVQVRLLVNLYPLELIVIAFYNAVDDA